MLLSIVLPAYNEEHRIGHTLDQLVAYRNLSPHRLEVLVVNDGSTDATTTAVAAYRTELPELTIIELPRNRGKGRAVAIGMTEARGAYRAFFDADAATPISELDRLLAAAQAAPRTVAIGSIRTAGSNVTRRQPALRTLAGMVGNAIIRAAVLPGVADSQRGCKLFPAEVADVVFTAQLTDGWVFDIEVLALCRALGYRIVEVPVAWTHVEGSRVKPVDYLWTLRDVLGVRRMIRSGAHGIPSLGRSPRRGASISPARRRAVGAPGDA